MALKGIIIVYSESLSQRTLPIYDIGGVMKVANQTGLSPENMSRFRECGTSLFDRRVFTH